MLYFNGNLNILNPFKAATVMPPNALNSSLIAKHKVFLQMDSAQAVLTTCQSTSSSTHCLRLLLWSPRIHGWKFQALYKFSAADFAQNITDLLPHLKGGSCILRGFSLRIIQGTSATESAFKPKPITTENKIFSRFKQDTLSQSAR